MDETLFARTGREIKKIARSKPAEHGLSFSPWSPAKPADFLVAEGRSTTSATRAFGLAMFTRTGSGPLLVVTYAA